MTTRTIQSLVDELAQKGLSTVSEDSLRQLYHLPDWVSVPPAFVELLNEHLSTITVGPEVADRPESSEGEKPSSDSTSGAGPDIFDIFIGLLGGSSKK